MNIICSYVRIISNKDPFNATIYLIVLYFHRMSLINCIFSISFFIYINGCSQIKRRNISNRLMAIGVRLYFSLILQKYVRAFFFFCFTWTFSHLEYNEAYQLTLIWSKAILCFWKRMREIWSIKLFSRFFWLEVDILLQKFQRN